MPQSGTNKNIEFDLYNIGDTKEYVQFAIEIERTLHKMQKEISNCLEPKKVALHIMRVATEFYNADWCGILDIDTEVGVFTPIWWYDTEFGEMGLHMAHPIGRVCGAKRPKCEAERSVSLCLMSQSPR